MSPEWDSVVGAAGQVGVRRKSHECEGFSSDNQQWRLFDPERGQLSGV